MKHILTAAAAVAVLATSCLWAPTPPAPTTTTTSTTTTSSTTTTTTSTTVPPRMGPYIDDTLIPNDQGHPGLAYPLISPAEWSTSSGDGSASFRTNCFFSHMGYDDPIVYPGLPGWSHLHVFVGNTGTNADSTAADIANSGNSTCMGGTANRSAYWAPAMIDTNTGRPLHEGFPEPGHFFQAYYKSGYQGVLPQTIVNFPEGLRMIADRAFYSCTQGAERFDTIPDCAPGSYMVMAVEFPQCWDGINLDSADHRSHMAYALGWPDRGCPDTHPVPFAQITQHYRYLVGADGTASWRLSSDMDGQAPGESGHADWINGWDPDVFQKVVDNCYTESRWPDLLSTDCSMNLLGDATMLGYEDFYR